MSPRHVFAFAVLIGWLLPAAAAGGRRSAGRCRGAGRSRGRPVADRAGERRQRRRVSTGPPRCTPPCTPTAWRSPRRCCRPARTPPPSDRYGVTPLYLASVNGSAEMIRRLLDAGVDPNTTDPGGETALMTAARTGAVAAMRLLIERGAAVDAREPEFQQTALMIAVREDHARCRGPARQGRRLGQRADAQGADAGVRAAVQGHGLRLGRRRHQPRRSAGSRPARRSEGRHDAASLRRSRRAAGGGAACSSPPAPTSNWATATASVRC